MSQTPHLEPTPGSYYSNGAYGRSWGVRQVLALEADAESGQPRVAFRGIAGTCRRKRGHCSLADFLRWARYEVALNENSWQRLRYLGDEADEPIA